MNILTLLEYNTQITLNKWKDKLEPQVDREGKSADRIVDELERMDPTKNKQYMMWLLRQFTANRFRLEDADRVRTALSNFGKIKHKLPTEQRDIGRLNLHDLEDIVDKVFNPELGDKQDAGSGRSIPEDAEVLYNGPLGLLIIPRTEEASCELGKGTKWCTAAAKGQNMFNHYSAEGPLYIWIDKNGDKYQFHFESRQFMDARDRRISQEQIDYFRKEHPVLKKLFQKQEDKIVASGSPILAYEYAVGVINGRFPRGEEIIAKNDYCSFVYAMDVLRSRFELGEPAIAKHPVYALEYAAYILKGRFPAAEKVIAKHAQVSYNYANVVLKGRFELGEAVIGKSIEYALDYARNIIGGRFPEGEETIAQLARTSMIYAVDVLKGRFKLGEPMIARNKVYASMYKEKFGVDLENEYGRFILGEPTITRNKVYDSMYKQKFRVD